MKQIVLFMTVILISITSISMDKVESIEFKNKEDNSTKKEYSFFSLHTFFDIEDIKDFQLSEEGIYIESMMEKVDKEASEQFQKRMLELQKQKELSENILMVKSSQKSIIEQYLEENMLVVNEEGEDPLEYKSQPTVSLPHPNNDRFIESINVSNNEFNGNPQINYNITTLQSYDLNFPITVSRNNATHKVNDMATNVGMGFNINTQDGIVPEVRGLPDFYRGKVAKYIYQYIADNPFSTRLHEDYRGYKEIEAYGYHFTKFAFDDPNAIDPSDPFGSITDNHDRIRALVWNNWQGSNFEEVEYQDFFGNFDIEPKAIDLYPDIYHYRAGSYSGKFSIQRKANGDYEIIQDGDQKVKIEFELDFHFTTANLSFTITTPDGNIFYFGHDNIDGNENVQGVDAEYREVTEYTSFGFEDHYTFHGQETSSNTLTFNINDIYIESSVGDYGGVRYNTAYNNHGDMQSRTGYTPNTILFGVPYVSKYLLSKIESPATNDYLNFNYSDEGDKNYFLANIGHTFTRPKFDNNYGNYTAGVYEPYSGYNSLEPLLRQDGSFYYYEGPSTFSSNYSIGRLDSKRLHSISSASGRWLQFVYTNDRTDIVSLSSSPSQRAKRLNQIILHAKNDGNYPVGYPIGKWKFEYEDYEYSTNIDDYEPNEWSLAKYCEGDDCSPNLSLYHKGYHSIAGVSSMFGLEMAHPQNEDNPQTAHLNIIQDINELFNVSYQEDTYDEILDRRIIKSQVDRFYLKRIKSIDIDNSQNYIVDIEFEYDQNSGDELPPRFSENQDIWGYPSTPDKNSPIFNDKKYPSSSNYKPFDFIDNYAPSHSDAWDRSISAVYYASGLEKHFAYEYNAHPSDDNDTDCHHGPGLRVLTILTTNPGKLETQELMENYSYEEPSFVKDAWPVFIQDFSPGAMNSSTAGNHFNNFENVYQISSSPYISSAYRGQSIVGYKKVTKTIPGFGYTETFYSTGASASPYFFAKKASPSGNGVGYLDSPANLEIILGRPYQPQSLAFSGYTYDGLIDSVKVYKEGGTLVQESQNTWKVYDINELEYITSIYSAGLSRYSISNVLGVWNSIQTYQPSFDYFVPSPRLLSSTTKEYGTGSGSGNFRETTTTNTYIDYPDALKGNIRSTSTSNGGLVTYYYSYDIQTMVETGSFYLAASNNVITPVKVIGEGNVGHLVNYQNGLLPKEIYKLGVDGSPILKEKIVSYNNHGQPLKIKVPRRYLNQFDDHYYEWTTDGLLEKKWFRDTETEYTYDDNTRRLTSVTDAQGQVTHFSTYDGFGRLEQQSSRNGDLSKTHVYSLGAWQNSIETTFRRWKFYSYHFSNYGCLRKTYRK